MRFVPKLPTFPSLLIKLLLVMLVPLNFYSYNTDNILTFFFNGLLFTPWYSIYPELIRDVIGVSANEIFSNFIIGFVIALPAMAFNYVLVNSPANRPLRNLTIGVLVITPMMYMLVSIFIFPLFYSPYTYYYPYQLAQNLQIFPTMVIGFFVILPMIQRQAALIAVPEDLHSSSLKILNSYPQFKVRREKTLATLLWFVLFFLPCLSLYTEYYYYSAYASILSFAYTISVYFSSTDLGIYLMGIPIWGLPITSILHIFRFVFVRDIYRYLTHKLTYRRLLYMGIFGDLFPIIGMLAINLIISPWSVFYNGTYPIPSLLLTGLLVARLHKCVLPHADRIWENVDARMWFEEEQQEPQQIVITPERPFRPTEETINVPLMYIVTSQIRKRSRNNKQKERFHE